MRKKWRKTKLLTRASWARRLLKYDLQKSQHLSSNGVAMTAKVRLSPWTRQQPAQPCRSSVASEVQKPTRPHLLSLVSSMQGVYLKFPRAAHSKKMMILQRKALICQASGFPKKKRKWWFTRGTLRRKLRYAKTWTLTTTWKATRSTKCSLTTTNSSDLFSNSEVLSRSTWTTFLMRWRSRNAWAWLWPKINYYLPRSRSEKTQTLWRRNSSMQWARSCRERTTSTTKSRRGSRSSRNKLTRQRCSMSKQTKNG